MTQQSTPPSPDLPNPSPPPMADGPNLDSFFADIDSLKSSLHDLDLRHRRLAYYLDAIQTAGPALPSLRSAMDADLASALSTASQIKLRLDSLDRANALNRSLPNSGPGSSADRTRTSVVAGLRSALRSSMETYSALRRRAAEDRREAAGRIYYAVTGERADEERLDSLVDEAMVRRAVEEGRTAVAEMEERRGAAEEVERSLAELQVVFDEMRVLVLVQGEALEDIEGNVGKAASFVREGAEELGGAREEQRGGRRTSAWIVAAVLMAVAIAVAVAVTVWLLGGRGNGGKSLLSLLLFEL